MNEASGRAGAEGPDWVTKVSGGLSMYLVASIGNLAVPWVASTPLSLRANSMRAVVAGAGILLALLSLHANRGAGSPGIRTKGLGVAVLCALAVPSIRWTELGAGTLGLLAVFAIPGLARMMTVRATGQS